MKTTLFLVYKGYHTHIDFDSTIKKFTGIIEIIDDLVYFESSNKVSVIEAFYEAVDDYLTYLQQQRYDKIEIDRKSITKK